MIAYEVKDRVALLTIDRPEVKNALGPDEWRELRAHVAAATVPAVDRELFATLTRYLAERENAWQAYSAALRAGNDATAAPDYAKYHEQDAAADDDARALGGMFRRLSPKPGS